MGFQTYIYFAQKCPQNAVNVVSETQISNFPLQLCRHYGLPLTIILATPLIVSVFITKILASHISHQQLSKFQQHDQRQQKKEPAMAYEGIQMSTLQVRQACREVSRNNCNID